MAYKPPEYLSPSSINTFLQCPLRFKYTRIDGVREPATEATVLGNLVHEVLETLYKLPASERSLPMARSLARSLWDEKYAEMTRGLVRSEKQNDFRWRAWFCIENLWKVEDPAQTEFEGIEYELNTQLAGVNIKGFVDRFTCSDDGQIVISDYKTGKVPGPAYQEDKFFQLFIYAALLEEQQLGKVESVELLFLKGPKRLSKKVNQSTIETTVATIQDIKSQIDERCDAEHFEYRKTQLCNWCHFKPSCPAWNNR